MIFSYLAQVRELCGSTQSLSSYLRGFLNTSFLYLGPMFVFNSCSVGHRNCAALAQCSNDMDGVDCRRSSDARSLTRVK